jgi:hypothetical protein
MPIMVYFGRPWDEKVWLFNDNLVFIFAFLLPFWFVVQGKFWQPCLKRRQISQLSTNLGANSFFAVNSGKNKEGKKRLNG